MHSFYKLPLTDPIPGLQASQKLSLALLHSGMLHIKTVNTLKWNWNQTASKQMWNCIESVSFKCADSLSR